MGKGERRAAVYAYIAEYSKLHGWAPSMREIGAAVGLSSTAAVEYHLRQLVADGLIVRQRYVSRGLTIVRKQPQVGGDERSTHFRGWAEMVWNALRVQGGSSLHWVDREADIRFIAQAAYDLVVRALAYGGMPPDMEAL